MTPRHPVLELFPDTLAIVRLDARSDMPAWLDSGSVVSVTRTPTELSIICRQDCVPARQEAQRGFRCLRVQGTIDFAEVGVLEAVARPLAGAGIAIMALSTFDTDYFLVTSEQLELATAALEGAGFEIHPLMEDAADPAEGAAS